MTGKKSKKKTAKRKSKSSGLLTSRFNNKQLLLFISAFVVVGSLIVYAFADTAQPDTDAGLAEKGTIKKFRNGTVVEAVGQDPVYVVTNEKGKYEKRYVTGPSIMRALGYTWEQDVIRVPAELLPKTNGPNMTADRHPNGTAIVSGNTYWLIAGDTRVRYASPQVMQSYGYRALAATAGDLKLPERKSAIAVFREGTIVKNTQDGKLYAIERHGNVWPAPATYAKRLMTPEVFTALGYRADEVINVRSDQLPANDGSPVAASLHPLGTVIKLPNDSRFWLVTKNGRAVFADAAYVTGQGYNPARAKTGTAPQLDLQLEASPFIKSIWYQKAAKAKNPPATYAQGVNKDYEQGKRVDWFVELQSGAQEWVTGGLIDNDTNQINYGLHMYNWALERQSPDGSFPGQTPHSTLFFTAALARSIIQLQRSPYAGQYAQEIASKKAALQRATDWLVTPAIWNENTTKNLELYGHRHFRDATALGLTALATGNARYMDYAHSELSRGLRSQYPDTSVIPPGYVKNPGPPGSIYEYYGYDVGYTGVSIDFANIWLAYFPDDPMTPQVEQMVGKAMDFERSRVVPVGSDMARLDPSGNSRSCVLSQGPNGELNKPGYASVIHDFAWWGHYKNRPQDVTTAQKLRAYQTAGKPQCPPF